MIGRSAGISRHQAIHLIGRNAYRTRDFIGDSSHSLLLRESMNTSGSPRSTRAFTSWTETLVGSTFPLLAKLWQTVAFIKTKEAFLVWTYLMDIHMVIAGLDECFYTGNVPLGIRAGDDRLGDVFFAYQLGCLFEMRWSRQLLVQLASKRQWASTHRLCAGPWPRPGPSRR